MATKAEKSKSELIREYLSNAKKPSEKGAEFICAALKEKGVVVSKQLFYQVKSSMRKKRRSFAAKKAATVRHSKTNSNGIGAFILAKNLLDSVDGDLKQAMKNLEIVSNIINS
jgi:hypothetical protein